MTTKMPYMLATGLIPKILLKIQEARRPERFTQDFLDTKLGFSGGSARASIPLLKRIGFLNSDGSPTELYDRFRNENTQGAAMASAIRNGFKELYDRNEYAHELSKEKLHALITQITGLEKDSRVVQSTVSTFQALKEFADFDEEREDHEDGVVAKSQATKEPDGLPTLGTHPAEVPVHDSVGLRLSYTINLNLPETTDPEVFNAIFRALKENLLKG